MCKRMRQHSKSVQDKEVKSEEQMKIVKHSSERSLELPTLETTDSIDKHLGDSVLAQNVNVTPKRCLRGKRVGGVEGGVVGNVVSGKSAKDAASGGQCGGDALNTSESHSSSLVNSVERTTAPSSIVGSLSRHEVYYNSSSSPGTNYQTPCGRYSKRRSISGECFEEMQSKEGEGGGGRYSGLSFVGSANALSTSGVAVPNGISNSHNQTNGHILLSAVLQVIASIQKMKSGEQSKAGVGAASSASFPKASGNAALSGGMSSSNAANAAAQILGSKLPGVHPTTAALALAYSLSVAAASTKKMAGGGSGGGGMVNPDDIIPSLSQLISERTASLGGAPLGSAENVEGFKITNELLQNIVTYLNSVVSHSSSQGGGEMAGGGMSAHQRRGDAADHLHSPTRANELRHESNPSINSSYNLKLPPMDFILNDKSMMMRNGSNGRRDKENANYLNTSAHSDMKVVAGRHHSRFPQCLELGTAGLGVDDSFGEQFERPRGGEEAGMHHFTGEGGPTGHYDSQTGIVHFEEAKGGLGSTSCCCYGSSNSYSHSHGPPFKTILADISVYSEKKITLESSGNYIWNDLSYNQVFDNVDFETPFSRKHAYLRNELLFYNKPALEIDHDGGGNSFSLPSYARMPGGYCQNNCHNPFLLAAERKSLAHHPPPPRAYSSSATRRQPPNLVSQAVLQQPVNNSGAGDAVYGGPHKYSNPKTQSCCDDLLINSNNCVKNSQIFNSISYLMQLVGNGGANNNGNNHCDN